MWTSVHQLCFSDLLRSLPWPTVLRVWDMFFFEGVKVLYKVALAVLNLAFSSPASQKECAGYMANSHVDFSMYLIVIVCSPLFPSHHLSNVGSLS